MWKDTAALNVYGQVLYFYPKALFYNSVQSGIQCLSIAWKRKVKIDPRKAFCCLTDSKLAGEHYQSVGCGRQIGKRSQKARHNDDCPDSTSMNWSISWRRHFRIDCASCQNSCLANFQRLLRVIHAGKVNIAMKSIRYKNFLANIPTIVYLSQN